MKKTTKHSIYVIGRNNNYYEIWTPVFSFIYIKYVEVRLYNISPKYLSNPTIMTKSPQDYYWLKGKIN